MTFDPEAGRPTPDRLAARVARAFLGVRIDCAQCHDHPFQPWKQADFRGLAAFFGGVRSNLRGIRDAENDYQPPDRKTKEPVKVEPRVPFCPELLPDTGNAPRTARRAGSSTSGTPTSPARRSTASGPSCSAARWPSRSTTCTPPASSIRLWAALADDFAASGYDLHRLIRTIAATEVFRLDSAVAEAAGEAQEEAWAVFPMTRAAARTGGRGPLPMFVRSRPSVPSRTGSSVWSPTPAATISSAATATPAKTNSTPAAARSPSASCS